MIALPQAFLVDTCVWIDQFNQVATPQSQLLSMALLEGASVWICGPVVQEVLAGVRHDAQMQKLKREFDALEYAAVDDDKDFAGAAHIYRACRKQGVTVRSSYDCLITQLCLTHDLPLLTSDVDFVGIAKATQLKLI